MNGILVGMVTFFGHLIGDVVYVDGRVDQYQEALDAFVRSDELGGPRNPAMLAYKTATYALLDRGREARTSMDLLSNFNGDFDWKDWFNRSYKNGQYAEQVLLPIAELQRELE